MNKVYNTVWNASTGVWVVTSELTRKGGRRPRQIRRTALAGLIAGLLLPSAPALAVDYNNETLGNGGTSSSMSVSAGDTATDTTINGGGYQRVSSGGSATSTTVNGGSQSIYSGGSATDTTLNSGGYQGIYDSASATSTTVNNGNQYIYNGGSATDTTLNSGGYQHIHDSASATSTTVNGGSQYIYSGGSATDTTLNSGGYQGIYDSASATSTTVNGGSQYIYSGGSAVSTTVNGGYQTVYNGGSATNTTINTGGIQNISGGSVTDTTLNDGGEQNVESGGVAVNTVINSGGTQKVNSGGSVTDTTINSGGGQYVYVNGNVTKTTITDGGILQVDTGGSASQVTQNSGGAIVTNTSAVLSGTNDKGTFSIAGGSASNMLLENGGLLTVLVGHDASDTTVGSNGTLSVQSGGVLRGTTTLTDNGTLVGNVVQNKGNLYFLNNSAATFAGALTGSGTLTQEGGNTRFSGLLSQDGGITLQSGAAMTMDTLQANANVTTQSGTTLTLDNGSILTGSVTGDNTGAGDMTVRGASVWHLGGDSTVGALTLDNGTVDFRPSATTRLTQAFRPVSLVAESLSGNGTFRMNTDIASHTGDMLNVTGNASGNFVLDIRNTGLEPVSAGTPLQVVHTGSGDAAFSLNGGKVDAGTWEYYLNKENTDWYLKADSSQPGTDNPGTDNPGTDNPVPPVRHTTKSADAVLDMATAPVYVFNSELQSLRFRHGDVMQNTRSPGGVWGRYTGSDTRISGGAGSGYSLTQSGMETGGDTVFDLNDSRLAVGAFVSYTDNSISHNRGGSSTVGSTGGGLYATWFNNDGYYVDGVIKVNRFRNELRTWMSDGTAVKGDYHQNGFGGSLEAGRTFSLNENTWIQPYLRSTAFRAESKDISLDNGMKAKAGTTKSLQGEVGVNLGMNLDVAGTVVRPYLTTAVSHEFSDNNRVRINASYNFTNDISGTTGKYGAGVSAQLTANAGVWAEASYQNGENTESPVTGSVGFRINF
ncbi:TPA: autotransporter outer membrane beta-barrel domain-containing protein [Escherichia coli]|nr:autotransporter outer membrane beta-barrel domain-containing protein [Escherichia coli]